jgi:hypothetical protein
LITVITAKNTPAIASSGKKYFLIISTPSATLPR